MHEVEESLLQNPNFHVSTENPLQIGFYLESITIGILIRFIVVFNISGYIKMLGFPFCVASDTQKKYSFIDMTNCSTGDVCYRKPQQGL